MPFLSWVEWHGAITHIPLAFLLSVPVFEIGAWLFRKPEWRIVSFWMLVGAVVMAVPSLVSGYLTGFAEGYISGPSYLFPSARDSWVFQQHWIAALATSGLAIILLAWRVKTRDRFPQRVLLGSVLLALFAAGASGYTGYLGGKMVFGGRNRVAPVADSEKIVPPPVQTLKLDPKLIAAGEKLFMSEDQNCLACHKMGDQGGKKAPDLTKAGLLHGDIQWQIDHLKDPEKLVPGSTMPAYDDLTEAELKALAVYLVSRR